MLDREQCENLEKWGLDQEVRPGERYWAESVFGGWREYCWLTVPPPTAYYKIPDLAELLDFAETLDKCWSLSPCPALGWTIVRTTETGRFLEEYDDSELDQLGYKLIERLAA